MVSRSGQRSAVAIALLVAACYSPRAGFCSRPFGHIHPAGHGDGKHRPPPRLDDNRSRNDHRSG